MNKNTFKFEVSFNLNLIGYEKPDRKSIQDFKDSLEGFVRSTYLSTPHFLVPPTNVKVKKTRSAIQKKKNKRI